MCTITLLNSVRFKTVRIYWCWRYTRSALWFTVCHRNGLVRPMYVSYLLPLSLFFSLPLFCDFDFFHLDLFLVAAILLEFAAQSSTGIKKDIPEHSEELSLIRSDIFCLMLRAKSNSYSSEVSVINTKAFLLENLCLESEFPHLCFLGFRIQCTLEPQQSHMCLLILLLWIVQDLITIISRRTTNKVKLL